MISVAKSTTSSAVPQIEWHVADAASLPLADDSCDVVLCQMGLMFMEDRPAALGGDAPRGGARWPRGRQHTWRHPAAFVVDGAGDHRAHQSGPRRVRPRGVLDARSRRSGSAPRDAGWQEVSATVSTKASSCRVRLSSSGNTSTSRPWRRWLPRHPRKIDWPWNDMWSIAGNPSSRWQNGRSPTDGHRVGSGRR